MRKMSKLADSIRALAEQKTKEELCELLGRIGAAVYASDSMADDTDCVDKINQLIQKAGIVPPEK